jgi:hypothetical protein
MYSQAGIGHFSRDVGTEGMEIESRIMLYSPGTDVVGGVLAAIDPADPYNYVGLELSLTTTTDELVVFKRNGVGSHTHYLIDTGMGLAQLTWYTLKLRYYAGVLTAWFDGTQMHQQTLTGPEQSSLGAGHTRAGGSVFNGWPQWDWLTGRSVV